MRVVVASLAALLCALSATAAWSQETRAPRDIVVTARIAKPPPPVPRCGDVHIVVIAEYELVEVVEGTFDHARFAGIVSCPEMNAMVGTVRLKLTSKKQPWPDPVNAAPEGMPTFWVLESTPMSPPETKSAGKLLGKSRSEVLASLKMETGEDEGWMRYGPNIAVRFEDGVATAVRARLARGLHCETAADWMGFGKQPGGRAMRKRWGCAWPGISLKHRLAPGVAATWRDGVFEVVRRVQ